jgi:ribulose-5-phosphate 4-epimerase/fuculose-1-phosphate aldolase
VNLTSLLHDLITANRILHYHSVVDAYGHTSLRSPVDSAQFIMSGNRAPALVASPGDFVYNSISNASSVDPNAPRGYIEGYIHSEIYKRFSNVICVIHAHAEDVMPYAISGVPLKPVFHLPGFLGKPCCQLHEQLELAANIFQEKRSPYGRLKMCMGPVRNMIS